MEELFKDLAWKCYQNDLGFEYMNHCAVSVWHIDSKKATHASHGSLGGGYEMPVVALKRIDKEVDDFIASQSIEETEYKSSNLTSYERHLKDAGHRQSDFY